MSQDERFPKHVRCDTHAFQTTLKRGKRIHFPSFTAVFYKNNLPYARIGWVTPKRRLKLSSRRNAFKRLVREYFRKHKVDLPVVDLIILNPSSSFKPNETRQDLDRCWNKINRRLGSGQP